MLRFERCVEISDEDIFCFLYASIPYMIPRRFCLAIIRILFYFTLADSEVNVPGLPVYILIIVTNQRVLKNDTIITRPKLSHFL
jgi:hypothetical protein